MLRLKIFFILFLTIGCALSQPLSPVSVATTTKTTSLVENDPIPEDLQSSLGVILQNSDFNVERYARHIAGGGIVSGIGVIGAGGFAVPTYAAPPVAVVSSVPVLTSVPVVTQIQTYPASGGYGGYEGGYGGGFGGFGAGFGVAKLRVKGFGFGGGFLG